MTVLVGESTERHIVHEQVLCAHSPFFTVALKKEWRDGRERTTPLPDDKADVVALYVQWAYRGKIFSPQPPSEPPSTGRELDLLVDCYIFGAKVQDDNFKDAVLDALLAFINTKDEEGSQWFPTGHSVQRAYEKTPQGSPLRKLLVDMHNQSRRSNWIKEDNSMEFLTDLAREMFDTRSRPSGRKLTDWNADSCMYHHHSKEEQCYSRKGV